MTQRIHIKIADRGWILEKCAREIANRDAAITFGTEPDPSADVQYYINYSSYSRRVSPVEIAFFTHSEKDENARRRYFDVAESVDHCVCMSERYARELIESGIPEDKVSIISPGVDLDLFRPKVRIGVVGRTYHTGRKGEALVAEVMDVEGIEWRFTGAGWPKPSVRVEDGAMPDFYNDLDYVLVPALYEGGPMAVLEGLACGVPIIASDVGWVNEYPHIAFENGNADSLREVLRKIVAEREMLRDSVKDVTWESWARTHIELFARLGATGGQERLEDCPQVAQQRATYIVSHGSERTTKGGPTTRISNVIACAEELGEELHYSFGVPGLNEAGQGDVVHVFNSWPLDTAIGEISTAKARGMKVVYSPIALNLSYVAYYNDTLPRIFHEAHHPEDAIAGLEAVRKLTQPMSGSAAGAPLQGLDTHFDHLRRGVHMADHVIYLSEYEKAFLDSIGAVPKQSTIVQNGVDVENMVQAKAERFRNQFGLDEFVLCVGRIETRKNQAALALAARELDCPLVLIGHIGQQDYFNQIKKWAGNNLVHIDRIEDRDLLGSAYQAASCFVLPSWAEGAPLAALEAAAAGTPLILSNMASEQEYFGEYAEYVHPCDVNRMTELLEEKLRHPESAAQRAARSRFAQERFGIEQHTQATLAVYEELRRSKEVVDEPPRSPWFDITHIAHALANNLNLTGVTAVEYSLVEALAERRQDLKAVLWNSAANKYLDVSVEGILDGSEAFKATTSEIPRVEGGKFHQLSVSTEVVPSLSARATSWQNKARLKVRRKLAKLAAGLAGKSTAKFAPTDDEVAYEGKRGRISFKTRLQISEAAVLQAPDVPPGSTMFLLGQPWIANERMLDTLRVFVQKNAIKLAVHVPDILYITDSSAFDDRTRKRFRRNLLKLLSVADHVITISQQADQEIRSLLKLSKIDIGTSRIVLGPNSELLAAEPRRPKAHIPSKFLLYVSSMNARKGHNFITDVWGEVSGKLEAQGHGDVGLVFAGSPQANFERYGEEDFLQELREQNIHVLSGVAAPELSWLYSNCLFTLYPARSEGWGIPPVESLCFGKVCVVSDTVPSAQESQCPGMVKVGVRDYFQWVDIVHSLITNVSLRESLEEHASAYSPPSWGDAADELLKIL